VLDSESLIRDDPAQLDWALRFLGTAPAGSFRVVNIHRPIWSPGPNGEHSKLKTAVLDVLKSTGVRVVFTGHEHFYYRTYREGITQITTAGGGAPLYDLDPAKMIQGDVAKKTHHYCRIDVREDAVIFTVIGLDGQLIDQFHLLTGRS